MKTVLVTGAAGFIGSHTAFRLLERGDKVVGIDNLNDYYDPARKRANLAEIDTAEGAANRFVFERIDVRDEERLERLFRTHGFDAVVHLAAMAGVRASIEDPELYLDVNLGGTLKLLEAAHRHGQPLFVFASTSSVYGATRTIPFIESDRADQPLAPYPASKRAAELLGHSFHHLNGQDFTALRFFTVYGPRGRPDMMAYKVLDNIFQGSEVPLYNRGQMHRDWTYIDDVVGGVLRAVDRPLGYQVLNLGRGEPILLADFVTLLEREAGKKSTLVDRPMLAADIEYTFADISKARDLLGYDPKVSVAEGVQNFWRWYRSTVLEP